MDQLQSEPPIVTGERMHGWLRDLFPICRSITGPGLRETLAYLRQLLPQMEIHAVPTATSAFDWIVPDEWAIREAWIQHEDGTRVVDFANHNLHVVSYSEPVDRWLSRDELQPHLYSLPEQPDAIPYVTSYYQRRWGFCLAHRTRESLPQGRYRVYIDSTLAPGQLNYGELVLPGRQQEEILLSTYVCHPSMANNELSGPVVAAALGQWLASLPDRRFTYRIVFVPETIGAIVFISRNLQELRANTVAGFVLTCLGDERAYSYLPSRLGSTLADRVALHVLENCAPEFKKYTFLDRGSDERQYCSPGVDLPICSIMRSKYATYPEYHTSLDDLSFVTPEGLAGGYSILRRCLETLEENYRYRATIVGEPQLGRRNLYPQLSRLGSYDEETRLLKDILTYCDGDHDLIAVANRVRRPAASVAAVCRRLQSAGLIAT